MPGLDLLVRLNSHFLEERLLYDVEVMGYWCHIRVSRCDFAPGELKRSNWVTQHWSVSGIALKNSIPMTIRGWRLLHGLPRRAHPLQFQVWAWSLATAKLGSGEAVTYQDCVGITTHRVKHGPHVTMTVISSVYCLTGILLQAACCLYPSVTPQYGLSTHWRTTSNINEYM